MKLLKRFLIIILILLVLIVGAAAAIPFFYKDQIVEVVKTEINQSINADVDFKDVNISLLRQFPKLSLGLEDLTVTGRDNFEGIELSRVKRADLALDLMSVISGDSPVRIKSFKLEEPSIHIKVLEDGSANYDIALASTEETTTEATTTEPVGIALESYGIENGRFLYEDDASGTYLEIKGLNHNGSGNLAAEEYDLDTETNIGTMSLSQGGIAYLDEAALDLDAIFHINTATSTYSLKDNKLQVNALELEADGEVQMAEDDDIRLDLSFAAPGNDFRQLWSIIPNAFIEGYENVKIDGNFSLQGLVKGVYNGEREAYPSFQVNAVIDNGNVKYPDLPVGINAIYANIDVNSPKEDLDAMIIDVAKLGLSLGNDPIKAQFRLATPISDPQVRANLFGKLNLAQWAKAFPVDGVEEMSGVVDADVKINTRMSTVESGAYDQVKVSGDLVGKNIVYQASGLPKTQVDDIRAEFRPQGITIPNFSAQLGKSDVRGSGEISNYLAYFSPKKSMRGKFNLQSNLFDVDEWMPTEEASTNSLLANEAVEEVVIEENIDEIFDRFAFEVDAEVKEIKYDVYRIRNSKVRGMFSPELLRVNSATTQIGESDFSARGDVTNIWDYVFSDGILGGDLRLNSQRLNLNDFMVESPDGSLTNDSNTSAEEEAYGVIPIPKNIAMTIQADVEELQYTNITLKDISSLLTIEDGEAIVEDGQAKMFGGNIGFSGAYDTKDPSDPGFLFKYDLQNLDFGKTYESLNTFQALAPIGQFINGKFNSSLILSGKLGPDMMPKLSTLNAEGFLQTLEAALNGLSFKPLAAVGNALDVDELKDKISLDNIKSTFTVENGQVSVKPFDVKVKDITMTVSGKHGLEQLMDYQLKTTLPRKYIENNAVGSAVSKGVNSILGQAKNLGINIEQGENVNMMIKLTGSLTDPKVGLKLLGIDGEGEASSPSDVAGAVVQDAIDEQKEAAKETVNQAVDSVRTVAEERVDQAVDSAKTVVQNQVDDAKKKAEEEAKKALGGLVDSTLINNETKQNLEDKFKGLFKKKKKKKNN